MKVAKNGSPGNCAGQISREEVYYTTRVKRLVVRLDSTAGRPPEVVSQPVITATAPVTALHWHTVGGLS